MEKMEWGSDPELSGPRNWFRESLIFKELKKYKKDGKVLDFGCGSGNLLFRFVKNGYKCWGIDLSPLAIKYINRKIKQQQLRQLEAHVGDETYLFNKKNREQFDAVVSGETIEHIKDDARVVKGFYNVIKKGGICVVSVPAHKYLWDVNDDFSSHFKRYEQADLAQLFINAGFKIRNVYYWGFPFSLIWHRIVYNRIVKNKVSTDANYSQSNTLFGQILSNNFLKQVFSLPFWFDQLFNWTGLGGGLILTAQKE